MRHIVLSENGETLADDALHRLLAVVYFPDSPRDQAQARFVAKMEKDEFLRTGQQDYEPSEIMQAISKMLGNRTAQLYAAGLVAISYHWLAATPYRPSLNRASIVVSYSASEFNKITWRSGLKPNGDTRSKAVTSDPATLERIFRKYRSVAHICAAYVSSAPYLESLHIWDETAAVTETLVQTAITFQDALERITETSHWNIWDLKRHYPKSLSGSPFLPPDDNLLYYIGRGYELALENGDIVNPDGGGS